MQSCLQAEGQSVYKHGLSVKEHTFQLIQYLTTQNIEGNWRLPDWLTQYRHQILEALLPIEIIEEYTVYHDCGKPCCLTIDTDGKRHFPNHVQLSCQKWLDIGGDEQVAKLMKMDMLIHTMKANDIDEFIRHPEAITLLIVGLAELHSNAQMFGGLESTSFKIKLSLKIIKCSICLQEQGIFH